MLIAFEGIDGAGKSTVSQLLIKKLKSKLKDFDVLFYKKSSTDFNDELVDANMSQLKEILWPERQKVPETNSFGSHFFLFLLAAWFSVVERSRVESLKCEKNLIVFDGWYYRAIAKGEIKGFDTKWMQSLFVHVSEPDLVILLDVDPEISWQRRGEFSAAELGKWDGFTGDSCKSYCSYQGIVRKRLLELAKEKSWFVVTQNQQTTPEETTNLIFDKIVSSLAIATVPTINTNKPKAKEILVSKDKVRGLDLAGTQH